MGEGFGDSPPSGGDEIAGEVGGLPPEVASDGLVGWPFEFARGLSGMLGLSLRSVAELPPAVGDRGGALASAGGLPGALVIEDFESGMPGEDCWPSRLGLAVESDPEVTSSISTGNGLDGAAPPLAVLGVPLLSTGRKVSVPDDVAMPLGEVPDASFPSGGMMTPTRAMLEEPGMPRG